MEIEQNVPRPRALVYGGPVADPRRPALAAQLMIGGYTVAQLAVAVAGGSRSAFFRQFSPVSTLLFLATIAVFLCWFHRCRLNAEQFAPGTHRFSSGLAIGAWFIPVVMWWIPRRITLDIWRAGSPVGGVWLVNAWWVAWLGKTVGGAIAIELGAPRPYTYSPIEETVGVVAGVLAILLIHRVTAGQHARVRAAMQSPPFARTAAS
ncbi:DUF4328 domain-containing protein [Kitasatospora sp. NPDC101157]|uniref:DUF4328 domain-containing protein n=1 Tax=Kitasatospora sp. NPDC101157 TaxID=3364098 RepID=UPI003825F2E8